MLTFTTKLFTNLYISLSIYFPSKILSSIYRQTVISVLPIKLFLLKSNISITGYPRPLPSCYFIFLSLASTFSHPSFLPSPFTSVFIPHNYLSSFSLAFSPFSYPFSSHGSSFSSPFTYVLIPFPLISLLPLCPSLLQYSPWWRQEAA